MLKATVKCEDIEDLLKNPFDPLLASKRRQAERTLVKVIDNNGLGALISCEIERLSAIMLALAYLKEKEINDLTKRRYDGVVRELASKILNPEGQLRLQSVARSAYRFEKFMEGKFWGQSETIQQIKAVTWSYCFGESLEKTNDLYQSIRRLGVCINGETGSGKEIIAQAIAEGALDTLDGKGKLIKPPFKAQNCAAIPSELLESELFGYMKGSSSEAKQDKMGNIESADGGIFFLDEIGDMPLKLQAKILRVIEAKEIQRLGETSPKPIDIRFVCATNKDLKNMVHRGTFRADLYFRFGLNIEIPPLRTHEDDIALISEKFVTKHLGTNSSSADLIERVRLWLSHPKVKKYNWPGNVRQLLTEIDKLTLGIQTKELDLFNIVNNTQERGDFPIGILNGKWSEKEVINWYSKHLMSILGNIRGINSKVAQRLGISPSTFSKRQTEIKYGKRSQKTGDI
jgi:transcriptional regulator with PAS, ATPase and Fis domain